jgi:hypothetical protein
LHEGCDGGRGHVLHQARSLGLNEAPKPLDGFAVFFERVGPDARSHPLQEFLFKGLPVNPLEPTAAERVQLDLPD